MIQRDGNLAEIQTTVTSVLKDEGFLVTPYSRQKTASNENTLAVFAKLTCV